MSELPSCPSCDWIYTYQDREFYTCPECGNEWVSSLAEEERLVRCSDGNVL